jgi:16S rRNA processing protein RimM
MDDLYIIAEILRPHGRRGEVVLRLVTDHLPTLTGAGRIFLGQAPGEPVKVEGVRMHKKTPLLKIEGVDDMNGAENLRGMPVCPPVGDLSPLEEGEYFLHDLVGLTLLDHNGAEVGKIDRILETGGPPVLAGTKVDGGSFMVPFADGTVRHVDLDAGTIRLADLPGLVNGNTA